MQLARPLLAIIFSLASSLLYAASPDGEWLVEDGSARVGIRTCGDELTGVVAWEKEHGVDEKNPDPAKRTRPTLGIEVLLGLAEAGPDSWVGKVYNAEDGKTYNARVTLKSPSSLEVQGCVPNSLLCGSEIWTKFSNARTACRR